MATRIQPSRAAQHLAKHLGPSAKCCESSSSARFRIPAHPSDRPTDSTRMSRLRDRTPSEGSGVLTAPDLAGMSRVRFVAVVFAT